MTSKSASFGQHKNQHTHSCFQAEGEKSKVSIFFESVKVITGIRLYNKGFSIRKLPASLGKYIKEFSFVSNSSQVLEGLTCFAKRFLGTMQLHCFCIGNIFLSCSDAIAIASETQQSPWNCRVLLSNQGRYYYFM